MNTRRLLPLVALLVAGCIQEKTLLVVNPDGSGSIVLDTAMTAEAAAMMQQAESSFAAAFGATNEPPAQPQELVKEEDLRGRAADFGEGVTFVRLKRTNEGGLQGAVAVYEFKDVRTVRLPLQQKGGDDKADPSEAPKKAVTFSYTPGEPHVLKINVPQEKAPAEPAADTQQPEPASSNEGAEFGEALLAPVMQMFKGLRISMAVQVNGEVLKSTASHREGTKGERAVLMALDFDALTKAPKFAAIFQKSQDGDMPTAALIGLPGFTYETKPEIEIQFK